LPGKHAGYLAFQQESSKVRKGKMMPENQLGVLNEIHQKVKLPDEICKLGKFIHFHEP